MTSQVVFQVDRLASLVDKPEASVSSGEHNIIPTNSIEQPISSSSSTTATPSSSSSQPTSSSPLSTSLTSSSGLSSSPTSSTSSICPICSSSASVASSTYSLSSSASASSTSTASPSSACERLSSSRESSLKIRPNCSLDITSDYSKSDTNNNCDIAYRSDNLQTSSTNETNEKLDVTSKSLSKRRESNSKKRKTMNNEYDVLNDSGIPMDGVELDSSSATLTMNRNGRSSPRHLASTPNSSGPSPGFEMNPGNNQVLGSNSEALASETNDPMSYCEEVKPRGVGKFSSDYDTSGANSNSYSSFTTNFDHSDAYETGHQAAPQQQPAAISVRCFGDLFDDDDLD